MNVSSAIAHYLERYALGNHEEAFHGLRELDHLAIPELSKAFHASTETSLRAFLLNLIRQHRHPSEIPILAEALFDSEAKIWREAMDGLVSLGSPESLHALRQGRTRRSSNASKDQQFSEWLEEAISQVETHMKVVESNSLNS